MEVDGTISILVRPPKNKTESITSPKPVNILTTSLENNASPNDVTTPCELVKDVCSNVQRFKSCYKTKATCRMLSQLVEMIRGNKEYLRAVECIRFLIHLSLSCFYHRYKNVKTRMFKVIN